MKKEKVKAAIKESKTEDDPLEAQKDLKKAKKEEEKEVAKAEEAL